MWSFRAGFICITAADAVRLFGILKCFSRNKNCLERFESSIISGSVIVIFPAGIF